MRMIEARDHARFPLEPRTSLCALGHSRGEHLHRDIAAEARVASTVDLTHPTRAERRNDFVRAEASTSVERHRDSLPQAVAPHGATEATALRSELLLGCK